MVRNIAVVRSPVRSASKRGRSQSSRYTEVYGLHFPQLSSRPAPTSVVTIIPSGEDASHPRFPAVEHVMGSKTATRDCLVVVKDSGYRPREFIVFFQYDRDASTPNQALKSVIPDSEWKGELLVMSRGSRHLVKNLKGREDQRLALLAVGGCVSVSGIGRMLNSSPNLKMVANGVPNACFAYVRQDDPRQHLTSRHTREPVLQFRGSKRIQIVASIFEVSEEISGWPHRDRLSMAVTMSIISELVV